MRLFIFASWYSTFLSVNKICLEWWIYIFSMSFSIMAVNRLWKIVKLIDAIDFSDYHKAGYWTPSIMEAWLPQPYQASWLAELLANQRHEEKKSLCRLECSAWVSVWMPGIISTNHRHLSSAILKLLSTILDLVHHHGLTQYFEAHHKWPIGVDELFIGPIKGFL